MSVQGAEERRGRDERGRSGLLERERALAALEGARASAREGRGEAVLFQGHAGMGKTRLHEAALDLARSTGMVVLRAAGGELESDLAYGVAIQLLRSGLTELEWAEREGILESGLPLVRLLAGRPGSGQPVDAGALSGAHSLFDVLAAITELRPVLLAIDDLHWCDLPSLEFLLYVLQRVRELPIALTLCLRSGPDAIHPEMIDRISSHRDISVVELEPLGRDAVRALVERALPGRGDEELLEICAGATGGNPFYIHELLLALAEEPDLEPEAMRARARALAPDAVARSLKVRVGRLGETAGRLARAVAVLGDEVPLRHAARIAGLPIREAGEAADALASVEVLLAREPLRFVHPLVRRSILLDIPASERATRHLDAARLLHAERAEAARVAAHLLLGRPQGNGWVVDQLREAARLAQASGAAQPAVRYLRRALDEPPEPMDRAEVLAELGAAEAAIGDPEAVAHLDEAAALIPEPSRRAELALQRGHALRRLGHQEEAAGAYTRGLRELEAFGIDAPELQDELRSGFLGAGAMVASLQPQAVAQALGEVQGIGGRPRSQGQRLLLAHAALGAHFSGRVAAEVTELAERAWDEGRLLEGEGAEGIGWSRVSLALALSGELERAVAVAEAARVDAQRRSSPLAFATASYFQALPRLWQGHCDDAAADLEQAREARRYGWRHFLRGAGALYALCLLERGNPAGAREVLEEDADDPRDDLEEGMRLVALAQIRLAEGQAQEAVDLAHRAGAAVERHVKVVGFCPWRAVAAEAALGAGEVNRARELAAEHHRVAESTQIPHARIRALRVLGLAEGGKRGTARLARAVQLGQQLPPRLETVRAQVDLGAALRRSNQRVQAREHLTRAADAARRGGLTTLYERARMELAATGARPRRDLVLSGAEALTASERRIAELASSGHSNRIIAQSLFITPKTVEYHLRNAYRKLGIAGRQELPEALQA